MFKIIVIISTLFFFANARAEVALSCESSGSWKMLPVGDDKLLDAEINLNFGGNMSIAGDSGIWSHFKLKTKTVDTFVFESAKPDSTWQTQDLIATVDKSLVLGTGKGSIVFKHKTDASKSKTYKCE